MSESADGFSVAATRQNAGRSANGLACAPPRPAGAGSAPAATDCANVTVVFGNDSFGSSSQDAAAPTRAVRRRLARARAAILFILRVLRGCVMTAVWALFDRKHPDRAALRRWLWRDGVAPCITALDAVGVSAPAGVQGDVLLAVHDERG